MVGVRKVGWMTGHGDSLDDGLSAIQMDDFELAMTRYESELGEASKRAAKAKVKHNALMADCEASRNSGATLMLGHAEHLADGCETIAQSRSAL
jgi:hypothetical protein